MTDIMKTLSTYKQRYEDTPISLDNPYHEGRYNLIKDLLEEFDADGVKKK